MDLYSEDLEGSRFARRHRAEFLTGFAYVLTTHNRHADLKDDTPLKEQFQNVIESELNGMRVSRFKSSFRGLLKKQKNLNVSNPFFILLTDDNSV